MLDVSVLILNGILKWVVNFRKHGSFFIWIIIIDIRNRHGRTHARLHACTPVNPKVNTNIASKSSIIFFMLKSWWYLHKGIKRYWNGINDSHLNVSLLNFPMFVNLKRKWHLNRTKEAKKGWWQIKAIYMHATRYTYFYTN